MKTSKKLIAAGILTLALATTGVTAFAASAYKTPAEAAAGVTSQSVSDVIAEHQETGKTYGTIAAESGKLEEFQSERLAIMKDRLDARVADGTLTQERADEIYNNMKENQASCDGTGSAAGSFGMGKGQCGYGQSGQGGGFRNGNGICQSTVF